MSNYRVATFARRRRGSVVPVADPLGAGNTALIGASGLDVTPLAFYDVRQHMTLNGSNVSSLADVSGIGTYGPALVQVTTGVQPPWDGTTINFNGGVGGKFLLSSTAVTGLDLSGSLTIVTVQDVQGTSNGTVVGTVGGASGATPDLRIPQVKTGPVLLATGDKNSVGASSTAASGTGKILLIVQTIVPTGSTTVTIEVPTLAKVTSGGGSGAEASGNQFIALGGTTSGTAGAASRFRALLAWSGTYTTGQRDTLKTWATTYHGVTLL